jgi:hypothetical protein
MGFFPAGMVGGPPCKRFGSNNNSKPSGGAKFQRGEVGRAEDAINKGLHSRVKRRAHAIEKTLPRRLYPTKGWKRL